MREKAPAPRKDAPRLPLFASLRRKKRGLLCSLLTLCGARCGYRRADLKKEKSQSKKERGETAAAPNLKKEKTRHPPKERANEKKKDPAKHPKKKDHPKETQHHTTRQRKRKMIT